MKMCKFIEQNREALEDAIHRMVPSMRLAYADIREWVMNDEGLKGWARREGVKV